MKIILKSKTFSGYKLHGRVKFQGLDISIENERGSMRYGTDKDGHEWCTFMHIPYGYIRLSEGTDGDHVDCYIGPAHYSERIFVVHQNDPVTGKYDEDKVMLGFNTAMIAKQAYLRQYDRPGFFGSMDEYSMDEFKELLKKRKGVKLKKSVDSEAMKHPNKLGARAKKRKRLSPKDKFDTVMAEFARGTLYSGSGEKVTDRNQALAIAFSESGLRRKKKKVEKSIRLVLRPKESIKNGTLIKVAGDWYFKGDGKARLGEDQPEEEMDSR